MSYLQVVTQLWAIDVKHGETPAGKTSLHDGRKPYKR